VSIGVRLFPAVHGHIADSVRDHGPGLVGAFGRNCSGRGSRSGRFTEPLALGFRCPPSPGEEPLRLPEDHWWIEGLGRALTAGSTDTHKNPADIGVSLWTDHAGQQPVPAWPAHGLQNATTGHGETSFQLAGAAPVSADLPLTWDVPTVDLSYTSRDGTDNGERSKGPVTCSVLMTQPVSKASATPR
jgi:hypothetical protein